MDALGAPMRRMRSPKRSRHKAHTRFLMALKGLTMAPGFPQIIVTQSAATDRRAAQAGVFSPVITTCLPHAPPVGNGHHWPWYRLPGPMAFRGAADQPGADDVAPPRDHRLIAKIDIAAQQQLVLGRQSNRSRHSHGEECLDVCWLPAATLRSRACPGSTTASC
jgi:hypothetical protein